MLFSASAAVFFSAENLQEEVLLLQWIAGAVIPAAVLFVFWLHYLNWLAFYFFHIFLLTVLSSSQTCSHRPKALRGTGGARILVSWFVWQDQLEMICIHCDTDCSPWFLCPTLSLNLGKLVYVCKYQGNTVPISEVPNISQNNCWIFFLRRKFYFSFV